jgi:trimeric autotransporter adhesin
MNTHHAHLDLTPSQERRPSPRGEGKNLLHPLSFRRGVARSAGVRCALLIIISYLCACQNASSPFYDFAGPQVEIQVGGATYTSGGTYSFGNIIVGGSSVKVTGTIFNRGKTALKFLKNPSITVTGANTSSFLVDGPFDTSVAPGASTSILITGVAAITHGSQSAALNISTNAGTIVLNLTSFLYGVDVLNDIVSGTSGSNPANFTVMGSTVFFTANDGTNGNELWKTDGTTGGTVMVKDINGVGSSNPQNLTVMNGTLYFTANDGTNGIELWKSNGTAAGTVMAANIATGAANSSPQYLTVMTVTGASTLFFQATAATGGTGTELYKFDGTTVSLVQDLHTGANNSSAPANLTVMTVTGVSTLFFSATDGSNGIELWKSDGTTITSVKDINPPAGGAASSSPANFFVIGTTLYFTATEGTNGIELWKSDGTSGGTTLVKDIWSGSNSSSPANFTNFGSTLYFTANDGNTGVELWKSDGTGGGTALVKDISTSISVAAGAPALSSASGAGAHSIAISTGSNSGKTLVLLGGGTATSLFDPAVPSFSAGSGALLPTAALAAGANSFSITSGTKAGQMLTVLANTNQTNWFDPATAGGTFSVGPTLSANAGAGSNSFAISSGTNSGKTLVMHGNGSSTTSLFDPGTNLFTAGPTLSATASTGAFNFAINSGTNSGKILVVHGNNTNATSLFDPATNLFTAGPTLSANAGAGALSFSISSGVNSGKILVVHGNALASTSVFDPATNLFASGPVLTAAAGNGAAMMSITGTYAGRTMVVCGNATATTNVYDPAANSFSVGASLSANATTGGFAFAITSGTQSGKSLMVLGGATTTNFLDPITTSSSNPSGLTVFNNTLYFSANDALNGAELWKTDGTTTTLVKDIYSGVSSSSPQSFAIVGSEMFFSAGDATNGTELFKLDSSNNVSLVRDINSGASSSAPIYLTPFGTSLIFQAFGTAGTEPHVYLSPQ